MGVLKVKDASGVWLDIAGVGSQGPPGGPVPVGGNVGEVIVKTGAADFEVGWQPARPRKVLYLEVASIVSHATINTFVDAVTGIAHIDPAREYLIMAGVRGVADVGATGALAQTQVGIGSTNLSGYDVFACHDTGLWGAWSQQWYKRGDELITTAADVTCELRVMLSVASKTFYSPRLTIIEF